MKGSASTEGGKRACCAKAAEMKSSVPRCASVPSWGLEAGLRRKLLHSPGGFEGGLILSSAQDSHSQCWECGGEGFGKTNIQIS